MRRFHYVELITLNCVTTMVFSFIILQLKKDKCQCACERDMFPFADVFNKTRENITLVTAYFDIGRISKGPKVSFDNLTYIRWAKAFQFVVNPLIVYTDSEDFFIYMKNVRMYFPKKTKVIKINTQKLWTFQLIDKISYVFSQPGYPKYKPNTMMPEYSAVQHTKYALVADTIMNKYFLNDFYAWIDIGYFRNSLKINKYFQLLAPRELDDSRIAINQINVFTKGITPYIIFRSNEVWVAGGMFIGKPDLLLQFEQLYKRAINHFLDENLMNTDQQLLYALYSEEGRKHLKPEIELQLYIPGDYNDDQWFYLGYHCMHILHSELCPHKFIRKKCFYDIAT